MRFLAPTVAFMLLVGTAASYASQSAADDVIILSVKPRSPDVKPELFTMAAAVDKRSSHGQEHAAKRTESKVAQGPSDVADLE